jgi:hypothetical protein
MGNDFSDRHKRNPLQISPPIIASRPSLALSKRSLSIALPLVAPKKATPTSHPPAPFVSHLLPKLQAKFGQSSQPQQGLPRHPLSVNFNEIRLNHDGSPPVQTKLTIGQPNDLYEQEADSPTETLRERVAEQVMSMPDVTTQHPVQRQATPEEDEVQTKPLSAAIIPLVQREAKPQEKEDMQMKPLSTLQRAAMSEDEEEVQTKAITGTLQRQEMLEKEEVQTKSALQRSTDGSLHAGSSIESRLNHSKGGGSPLPDEVRSFMEPRFGADFSQVRVHTGSDAAQMNWDLNAQAFTHQQDVYFGAGKYDPASNAGKQLLAHELTHVVQQTGAAQSELINRSSLNFSIKQVSSTLVVQLKHLSIPETVANFRNVVTPGNEVPGSPTLVEAGQFYWTKQIIFAIGEYISGLQFIPAHEEWRQLLNKCDRIRNTWPLDQAAQESQKIRQEIAGIRKRATEGNLIEISLLPLLPLVEPLLKPAPKSGEAIYYELWSHLQKGDQIPSLDRYRSLPTLQSIWSWENQACGYTGSQVATRYTRKGGAKKANPDAKRGNSTRVWAAFATSANRDMRPSSDAFRRGDVLIQNGVSSAIPKMQAALDDGWILHARVLSGIDYGHGEAAKSFDKQNYKGKAPKQPQRLGKPPEEHSIMIIGYDASEFVFWDPDSVSSNRRGAGFGSLFFSNGRLSTARNDADLVVDINGDHHDGNHRYQIIHLGSQ